MTDNRFTLVYTHGAHRYETSIAGTPGSWNTAFATAPTAQGPWAVLDDSIYRMALDVEVCS